MAGTNSKGGGPPSLNLNSLLALVALLGGVWLVSHQLTSDRPVTPAGGQTPFPGEQTLDARLWEEPFKDPGRDGGHEDHSQVSTNLNTLVDQIGERLKTKSVLLLPVMLSGGQYSEDQESRIRSRFAVVSALGRSGYAPEDAEHIGVVKIPWLTQLEMAQAKKATSVITNLWLQDPAATNVVVLGKTNTAFRMDFRYEWYRRKTFFPKPDSDRVRPNVLVLWLDDSFFEDEPLLRLALLLEPLVLTNRVTTTNGMVKSVTNSTDVALIGPRRSSTLRAMLPDWEFGTPRLSQIESGQVRAQARAVLHQVSVYCATPSAMDEVLVNDPPDADEAPRKAVAEKLAGTNHLVFRSFQNFAATDGQLAREALAELALRGARLQAPLTDHLVLISEWDTFYARMLILTYAAELARLQHTVSNRAEFVTGYISGEHTNPPNFHSFTYLRGLDGQTVGGNSQAGRGRAPSDSATKSRPTSLEELLRWTPDPNKAVGQAQFDYLARLGHQLTDLAKRLHREGRGRIEAIGIVGSDVYDTLLILQALRGRFPDVLFFTTDLDARFLHPREREWARNLIVISGYGLQLHPALQVEIAEFRDSAQTAQFAAVLAALGDPDLARLTNIPPRRFEIGNRTAVDLSTTNALLKEPKLWLHPLTPGIHEGLAMQRDHLLRHSLEKLGWGLLLVLLTLAGACWFWQPLRRLTIKSLTDLFEVLEYSEEDVGGPDGAVEFLKAIDSDSDPISKWIANEVSAASILKELEANPPTEDPPLDTPEKRKREQVRDKRSRQATDALVHLFNSMSTQRLSADQKLKLKPAQTGAVSDETAREVEFWTHEPPRWNPLHRLWYRRAARRFLDARLGRLTAESALKTGAEPTGVAAVQAAAAARTAALEIFRLRRLRLCCFWIGTVALALVAAALGASIWDDTSQQPEGERFSLTSGTSVWPAEILRLIVLAAAGCLSFELYHRLRETYFKLTRKFRLADEPAATAESPNRVCAVRLWHRYRDRGSWRWRLGRLVPVLLLYLLVLLAVANLWDQPVSSPVRGPTAALWNEWLLRAAVLGFLALAFLTVDAAWHCRRFIRDLSQKPTEYPAATRRHFSRQRGNLSPQYLGDWIDLQLIADLTERVSSLVYFPSWLLLLLMVARNSWWDRWAWPVALVLIFALNVVLAAASVFILQRAAREAKREAEERLASTVKKLRSRAAPSPEQNDADRAQELLEEIRMLRRGAFVPFWENPAVGAVVLSSGGTTLLQVLIWFMGR